MRVRLYNKITIVVAAICGALLLAVFLYLNGSLQQDMYKRVEAGLRRQLGVVRLYFDEVSQMERVPWQRATERIAAETRLRATIIDAEGHVLADSDLLEASLPAVENHWERPEIQAARVSPMGTSRRFSTTVQQEMLYVAAAFGEPARGFVRLAMPLADIQAAEDELRKFLIIMCCGAFLVSAVAGYGAARWVARPLLEISRAARLIASGDFSSRAFVQTRDEVGELAGTFNDMADHIERYIGEIELNRSRMEAVFAGMTDGVLVVDGQGRVFLLNAALRRMMALSDRAIGQRPLEVILNADVQDIIKECLGGGGGSVTREVVFSDPVERHIFVQGAPVMRGGINDGAVLVFHDETELRKLERIRRDFIANVSHELRTPVTNIKGYADTLMDGALTDPVHAPEFVRTICSEADHLARLIEDILDLSALESGRSRMDMAPCSLAALIEKASAMVTPQAHAAGITVRVEGAAGIAVLGDERSLVRVFINLLDNGIKYNKSKGTVTVSAVRSEPGWVEVRVEDTGIGIPERDQPRIFERFYRVDKAHSRQMGGTGLGLSIVKHIIQAHGGTVSLVSRLDQGSCFILRLPSA